MTTEEKILFIKDLQEIAKKHKVAIVSGKPEYLAEQTKEIDGLLLMFVNGNNFTPHKTGENVDYASTITITRNKIRYGKQ